MGESAEDGGEQLELMLGPLYHVVVGIFGEHEFVGALFPGYLTTLGYAGFIPRSLSQRLLALS
ncbi:MAG: hypothetical protein WKF48_11280 [Solirubrobacteraceae bacterium]